MKIVYLHSLNKNQFNDAFEEIVDGLKFNNVTCKVCPKEIKYKDVKGCDIVIFDTPSTMKKMLGYLPQIIDKQIYNLKLGIFSADFWVELCSVHTEKWLRENQVSDFIIFRHSSGFDLFNKKFKMFKKALKEKINISKSPHKFVNIEDASINFKNAILSPFTISSDRMKLSDNIKKEYDLCLGGHVCSWYPLREKIFNIVSKSKFKIIDPQISRHSGKRRELFTPYYDAISKSWLSLATTGLANISVRKHLEICGLGSTWLGNETGLPDHDLIRSNGINIDISMTDNEILSKIEESLSDKKRLQEMVNSVKDKVREEYDYRNVAKKLCRDLGDIK